MAVVDVLARLKADTSQFTTAMSQAQKATENLTKSSNTTASFLTGKFRLALVAAGTAAGVFAIKLGVDSVRAAQQAGAAQNRLARLLINTGGATQEQIGILNQQAAAL